MCVVPCTKVYRSSTEKYFPMLCMNKIHMCGYRRARKHTFCCCNKRPNKNPISSRSRMARHLQSGVIMHRRFNNSKGHFLEAITDTGCPLHCLLAWYLFEVPESWLLFRLKSLELYQRLLLDLTETANTESETKFLQTTF